MRRLRLSVLVLLTASSCRRVQTVSYANSEGVRFAADAPALRPGRTVDSSLRAAQRGELVVQFRMNYQPNATVVTVRPAEGTRPPVEQAVDSRGITEFRTLVPGEYTVKARSIGFQAQTVRILIAAGFADTLVFTLGQP